LKGAWVCIKLTKLANYVTLLQENPKEGEILFKELMIGVTSFFRDSKVWENWGRRYSLPILSSSGKYNIAGLGAWLFYR
jgi:chemotaxis methyl-accepting protein methylase